MPAALVYEFECSTHSTRMGRSTHCSTILVWRGSWLLCSSTTLTWQGNIHAAGDDALSYLTLKMTGKDSSYQGTWQLNGENAPLQQGSLSASKQGDTSKIKLEKFSGNKAIVLSGTVGATAMSGKVSDTNLVFFFTKS